MQLQLWARNIAPGSSIEVVSPRPLYLTNVSLSCDFQNAFAPTSLVLSIVRTDRRTSPSFTIVTLIVGQSLTQHIHVRLDASIKYVLSVKGSNTLSILGYHSQVNDTLILPNMESANQNSNDLGAAHATPAITISPPIPNGTRQPPSGSESTNPTVSNVATSSLPLLATGPSDTGLTGDGRSITRFDKAPSTGSNYSSGQSESNSSSATATGFGYASLAPNSSSSAYTNLPVQAPRPEPYESAMGSNNGDYTAKKMKIEDGTTRRQYLPTGTGIIGQMGGNYTGSDRSNVPEVTNPKKRKSTADNDGASPLALPPHLNMSASSSSVDRARSSSPHPPPAAHSRQNFLNTSGTNNSHLNSAPQAGPSNYHHMASGTSAGYSSRNPFASPSTAGK
ncbi:hypothetical protein EV368DRAFT_87711 [Lentinula lateritia]|nr:hypothetical protein EV368DRAFT_87711 [Lentinula lateritia]